VSTSPATRTFTRQSRRFRRGLTATILVLALACAAFGVASVLQGPRIQGAQIDLASAVIAPSSLRIVLDEAVAPLGDDSVSVDPAVPVTVQNDGDVVLVHFEQPLDYDTKYSVSLTGVGAAAGGVSVDLTDDIRTPAFTATWLQRADSGDRVLSASPGGEPTTLFTGARIQDYLRLDDHALLVVSVGDDDASHAAIVATDGSGNSEGLTLPGAAPGRIGSLTLVGSDVLYTFTSVVGDGELPTFDQTLFRLDLGGTHISDPVNGVDGSPLSVDTVIPIPGSTAVLLHSRAGEVLRYDPTGTDAPTLVAKYQEMIALGGDRHSLSVKDAFGPLIYDFDDGSETHFNPSPISGTDAVPFIADVVPLSDGRRIQRAVVPNADFTSFDSFVALDDGTSSSVLFRTADSGGSILDYRVTPNERYLVAEVSPGGDLIENRDGYAIDPRPRDVTVVVIDIAKDKVVAEWPGSHPRW
jgi:hypothetical protein